MNPYLKKVIVIIAALLSIYLLIKYVLPYFLPFIFALLFSLLLEPAVRLLHKKFKIPRGPAVGLAMLGFFGAGALIITVIISRLIMELVKLSSSMPAYSRSVQNLINDYRQKLEYFYWSLPDPVLDLIKNNLGSLEKYTGNFLVQIQNFTTALVNGFLNFLQALPGGVTIVIVTAIATYFISRDRYIIINSFMRVVPAPYGEKIINVIKDIFKAFVGYLRAQLILISITTLQSIIGLYIIGSPYALTMGLLIGFFDIIPVLGPSTVFVPWIIYVFIMGNIGFGLKLLVLFALVLGARQVLEAKIVAQNIGLHPLATLIAMYLGLRLFGVLGLILGPIVVIAIKAIIKARVISLKI